MKRTIAILLLPTLEQATKLADLQTQFVAASNVAAILAHEHRTTNRVRLHHIAYYLLRKRFPRLGAQMTCNAIARAARSLRTSRANGQVSLPALNAHGAVHVDARTFRLVNDTISLFTLDGRQHIVTRPGNFQRNYLDRGQIKEGDLVFRHGQWYLHIVLDLPDTKPNHDGGFLGVDLGENVIAATSNGTLHKGTRLRDRRDRFLALSTRLQRNGSHSAKQLLVRISGKESRYVRHVNHEISRALVREAHDSGFGTIVLEDLSNIRSRIRMRKRMRQRLHRWAWRQLQFFIEYKAQALGIRIIYANPAYTSQTCCVCGNMGARSKHRFSCSICGIFAHSDRNAARNLAKIGASAVAPKGDVTRPDVAALVADYETRPFRPRLVT